MDRGGERWQVGDGKGRTDSTFKQKFVLKYNYNKTIINPHITYNGEVIRTAMCAQDPHNRARLQKCDMRVTTRSKSCVHLNLKNNGYQISYRVHKYWNPPHVGTIPKKYQMKR